MKKKLLAGAIVLFFAQYMQAGTYKIKNNSGVDVMVVFTISAQANGAAPGASRMQRVRIKARGSRDVTIHDNVRSIKVAQSGGANDNGRISGFTQNGNFQANTNYRVMILKEDNKQQLGLFVKEL